MTAQCKSRKPIAANVHFYKFLAVDLLKAIAENAVHPSDAKEGDVVGICANIWNIHQSMHIDSIQFLVATKDPDRLNRVYPMNPDLLEAPGTDFAGLYKIMAALLSQSFDFIVKTDSISMHSSAGEDGYYELELMAFDGALMVVNTTNDNVDDVPEDLETSNALFMLPTTSAHATFDQQPRVDAILRLFEHYSMSHCIINDHYYAPVHLPFQPGV